MRKRYGIIVVAIIMLMISGVLFINKSSYAETDTGNYCPDRIYATTSYDEVAYAKNENNKITLPTKIYDESNQPRSSSPPRYRVFVSNGYIFEKVEKTYNSNEQKSISYSINRGFERTSNQSILMGYLVSETHFSNDKDEDDYYKQLLVLWAMDRLAGFEDDKNYIYDWNTDQIIETDVDTAYEDKYNIDEYTSDSYYRQSYYWKYVNNLSAGDKTLLIDSEYGDKMLDYLNTWEDYVDWYLDGFSVELDSVIQEDISYHVTNDYIETNLITPTSTNKAYSDQFSRYVVTVSEPMIVVNQGGEEQTEFNAGESFRVRIPISEIENQILNYSIRVKGYFDFDTFTLYQTYAERYEMPSDEKMQLYYQLLSSAITESCKSTETMEDNILLEFTQRVGNLDVRVIDASTGDNLSSAEVAIYDSKSNEVYRYETTDDILHLTLPVGDYVIKQTVTPPNYEPTTIQMRVSVLANDTTEAVLENVPLVNVPDTAMNATIFIIIGGLIVAAGGIVLVANLRKKKGSH